MDGLTIKCVSCGQAWVAPLPLSLYEQQAVESCPCPRCGAYTLCCREPVAVEAAPHWLDRLDARACTHTEAAL